MEESNIQGNGETDISLFPSDNNTELPPTIEEVKEALAKIKNNKAPGIDLIQGELLENAGEVLINHLHELLVNIWTCETIPEEWKLSILCPIHKKGDIMTCSNYRGISLLSTAYKILSNILFNRLYPYVDANIGDYQCGFRRGRSTVEQIFNLRQILEKSKEFLELHVKVEAVVKNYLLR